MQGGRNGPGTGETARALGSIISTSGSPGAACESVLEDASHAQGIQLGCPWNLLTFNFCLGNALVIQPRALIVDKSAAHYSLNNSLANKPRKAWYHGAWSHLGLLVLKDLHSPQHRHRGAHP